MDGTLLDWETFDAGPNRALIQRLHGAGVPVVPVSIMTLEEMEPIANELGLRNAMVIEAGGAIARWVDGAWQVEPCGPPAETLLDVIRDIEDRSGADLMVYSALPDDDAARVSGRTGEMLLRSTHRRYSEPFLIEKGSLTEVKKAAASIGFSVRRGRRFLHLCRSCDEGEAFTRLREELRCDVAIAIGGSPVDAEFLSRAEIPVIVPDRQGRPDPELVAKLPGARIAPAAAPLGWAAALRELWPEITASKKRVQRA
jgi:mannosyl-3-phosphoglycerate phosphatase family protein